MCRGRDGGIVKGLHAFSGGLRPSGRGQLCLRGPPLRAEKLAGGRARDRRLRSLPGRLQPALARAERIVYHDLGANRGSVPDYIERLRRCDGMVLVFPTWWYGMPAILKGYIDRVWLPGVVFKLDHGRTRPILDNIKRFAVVTTYGSPWWLNKLIFDHNRSMLMRR